jgi:hypothetical protein
MDDKDKFNDWLDEIAHLRESRRAVDPLQPSSGLGVSFVIRRITDTAEKFAKNCPPNQSEKSNEMRLNVFRILLDALEQLVDVRDADAPKPD